MKKMIVCSILALILLYSACLAFADDHVCTPNATPTDITELRWHINANYHSQSYYRLNHCIECGAPIWQHVRYVIVNEPHSLYLEDDWHGIGTHSYLWTCSICGYTKTETSACDGPPCNALNSLPSTPLPMDVETAVHTPAFTYRYSNK